MPCNKFIIGDKVIIDLSNVTVRPDRLKKGVTAHDADGNLIIGTAVFDDRIWKHEIRFVGRYYDHVNKIPVGSRSTWWMYAYIQENKSYTGSYTITKDLSDLKDAGMYDADTDKVWYFVPEEKLTDRVLAFKSGEEKLYIYLENDVTYGVPYLYDTVTLYEEAQHV